jgi:hypothetical protein
MLKPCQLITWRGKVRLPSWQTFAKSLLERLLQGKRALTGEMQREEDVQVVMEYSDRN